MDISQFVYLPICRWTSGPPLPAGHCEGAIVSMPVHAPGQASAFGSFVVNLGVELLGHTVPLHSRQRRMRTPFLHTLGSSYHFPLFYVILILCEVAPHCGFDAVFLNDVECLFMGLLAVCVSSLEKYLFLSFAHF